MQQFKLITKNYLQRVTEHNRSLLREVLLTFLSELGRDYKYTIMLK